MFKTGWLCLERPSIVNFPSVFFPCFISHKGQPPNFWLAAADSTPALLRPFAPIWSHKHEDTVTLGCTTTAAALI